MLKHTGTAELKTRRLWLRRFAPEDAQVIFSNYAGDDKVTRYLTWPTHRSVEDTEGYLGFILPEYESDETYRWAIECEGTVVGSIDTVMVNSRQAVCEIGYCLGSKWWGRGIMTEALKAVIGYLFENVGFECICACHDPENPASGRVMEKAGMKYEGTLRSRLIRSDGKRSDLKSYSILRDEYLRG